MEKVFLISNLGSPDSTRVEDVRRYLNEFLMDEKVIDIPWFFRYLVVRGIITRFRAYSSAKKYAKIWTKEGAPLIWITENLADKIADKTDHPTYICMRYGNPTPHSAFERIEAENPDLKELVLLPLFPHFAMSSYETNVDYVKSAYDAKSREFSLKIVPPYYDHPDYINVLAESMRPYIQKDYDLMLFSYHGVPERHIRKSDITGQHCLKVEDCCHVASEAHQYCYRHQVIRTTELVAERLHIPPEKYRISFQSRLGPDKWLQPSTASLLEELPKQGIRKLVVSCPAFVSDCLETLEEIHDEGKEIFLEAGGESFQPVPCLNVRDDWVDATIKLMETAR